jgi:peptidoglycan hydrolase-like protein with peptidoglycan-binding domain
MGVTRAALLAAVGVMLAAPGAAQAATAAPPPPAAPAPAPLPVPGRVTMTLVHAGGQPAFALIHQTIHMRGVVSPYVAGQVVKVSIYRESRKLLVEPFAVKPRGDGSGEFRVSYSSSTPGLVKVRVVHYATTLQAQFTGRSPDVRYAQVNLSPGSRSPSVRLLQSELNALHYAVPLSGVFDEGTGRALTAYRKMTGMEPVASAGWGVFERLERRAGAFHVHYSGDGRHVEANLTRQVLAEIDPHGRVRMIYTMSSGKPSTPTVVGRFRVYSKTPGTNSEGMVDSNYFIRGYAIHGYAEVPTYAASHGCLRVPIPDAAAIYAWVREGTPVDVYHEGGGGSTQVRGNAGP